MFVNAQKLFYFHQYFVIRLGEKTYVYQPEKDSFPIVRALLSLVLHALKGLLQKSKKFPKDKHYRHLVYLETINQKNAVVDVFAQANREEFLFVVQNDVVMPEFENQLFPSHSLFCKALLYFPKAVLLSRKYRDAQKGVINGAHILVNFSLFLASVDWFATCLQNVQCEKIILTNDHNLQPLALLYAARKARVKSYYIQHASVSEAFPKLLPDVALLEGQQAVDTYKKIGNLSRTTKLVGIARMDGLLNSKTITKNQDRVVGLCLKPYYSKELIENLIAKIQQSEAVGKIILRPHPGNSQAFYDFLEGFNVTISNAKTQRPHEFIRQLDVMISGESSILLEAALMKVKTLYIDDKVARFDLYGFVKNGITEVLPSLEDLPSVLSRPDLAEHLEDYYQNCQYYCSTVNTQHENKSKELILKSLIN